MKKILHILLVISISTISAFAHSGGTDSSGGHYDHSSGDYHYHSGGGNAGNCVGGTGIRLTTIDNEGWQRWEQMKREHYKIVQQEMQNARAAYYSMYPVLPPKAIIYTEEEMNNSRAEVISNRVKCAKEGLPLFQYELALNYLNGTDGFATNRHLGVLWMRAAATGGNKNAKMSISNIDKPVELEVSSVDKK